jgi:hypothetical protein
MGMWISDKSYLHAMFKIPSYSIQGTKNWYTKNWYGKPYTAY